MLHAGKDIFFIATVVYSQKSVYKIDPFRYIAIILYKKVLISYTFNNYSMSPRWI